MNTALRTACVLLTVTAVLIVGWIVARWGADRWRHRSLRYLLRCAALALQSEAGHGLTWWVDFGSLLGIVRDGDVIPGDNDADISVRIVDDDDRVRLLACLRWCTAHFPGLCLDAEPWQGAHAYRLYHRKMWLDVYHARPDADGVWYHGATGVNSNVRVADIGATRPWWWERGDVVVRVPDRVHAVLEWRYGADWRVPKPGFKGRDS